MDRKTDSQSSKISGVGVGIAIGIAIGSGVGAAVGVALHNIAKGVALGSSFAWLLARLLAWLLVLVSVYRKKARASRSATGRPMSNNATVISSFRPQNHIVHRELILALVCARGADFCPANKNI